MAMFPLKKSNLAEFHVLAFAKFNAFFHVNVLFFLVYQGEAGALFILDPLGTLFLFSF